MFDNFLDETIPEALFFVNAPQCRTRREAASQWQPNEIHAEPCPPSTSEEAEILHRITHPFAEDSVIYREIALQNDGSVRKSVRIGRSNLAMEKRYLELLGTTTSIPVPLARSLHNSAEFEHLVMSRIPGSTLEKTWHSLSEQDREKIADQVVGMIQQWRQLRGGSGAVAGGELSAGVGESLVDGV